MHETICEARRAFKGKDNIARGISVNDHNDRGSCGAIDDNRNFRIRTKDNLFGQRLYGKR